MIALVPLKRIAQRHIRRSGTQREATRKRAWSRVNVESDGDGVHHDVDIREVWEWEPNVHMHNTIANEGVICEGIKADTFQIANTGSTFVQIR